MIGKTISHYRVIEKIGVGGMGEVYRAEDPRLEREVAIKVLPGAFSGNPDRLLRFEREARAVGALNHPNVLAVYDVGDDDGVPYIVSELLQGETLREHMDSGLMTRRKAVEYAVHVAEGLAAAHSKRIVHRDLKPQNVFLTRDGQVKILDFGLAKAIYQAPEEGETAEGPTADMVTEEGSVVGTAAYMSPEQLQGLVVDHRSDIFSFGVMLYEMLADRRPFEGDSKAQIVASILRDEPDDLSSADNAIPPALDRVVRQCLEKRPGDRFESARDLAFTLKAITDSGTSAPVVEVPVRPIRRLLPVIIGGLLAAMVAMAAWMALTRSLPTPLPDAKHIAVIAFETVGDEPDDALVAAGLTEIVADGLALLDRQTYDDMWVVPSDSLGPRERLWRWHGINLALTGELRIDDDEVWLELTVLDGETGRPLRSTTLEDRANNLSWMQQAPVLAAARVLEIEPSPETSGELDHRATNIAASCRYYLRGRGASSRRVDGDLDTAIELLRRAIDEDPGHLSGGTALADAYLEKFRTTGDFGWYELGVAEATRVLDRDDRFVEALDVLGGLHLEAGSWEDAIGACSRAARLAPGSGWAQFRLGDAYASAGLFDEAQTAYQNAINLLPGNWQAHDGLGYVLFEQNEFAAAANHFRRWSELVPLHPDSYNSLGASLYFLGRFDAARSEFERSIDVEANAFAFSQLGTIYFEEADYAAAAELHLQAVSLGGEDSWLLGNLAASYHWGGELELSEQTFRRAIVAGMAEIEENPEDAEALARLGEFTAIIGDRARALELLDRAAALEPSKAQVLATVGEAFETLGERERAVEWLVRALDAGLPVWWIERKPSLRKLEEDPVIRQRLNTVENRSP